MTGHDAFAGKLIQHCAVPAFVLNPQHRATHWNKACEELTGFRASDIVGTDEHWKPFYSYKRPCLADLVITRSAGAAASYYTVYGKSTLIPGGLHAEGWYEGLGGKTRYIIFDAAPIYGDSGELLAVIETLQDITERKCAEEDKAKLIDELRGAIAKVKTLSGLLPICSSCKKVRDDKGYWRQVEEYVSAYSEVEFSHGVCPDCMKRLYPGYCKRKSGD